VSRCLVALSPFPISDFEVRTSRSASSKDVTPSTVKQSSLWRQGLMQQHVEGSFRHADRSRLSPLHICEPVSLFYHLRRQNIGTAHIPEALPPTQCYSYTTTSSGRLALVPKARHLAKRTVGFSIWASDLESVQELKPHGSDSWRNLAFRKNITARLHSVCPFPSILPHYPKL
jgi:hypothetical protein